MSDVSNSLAGYMIPEHNGSEYSRSMFLARTLMANFRTHVPVRVVKVYAQDGKTTATRGAVAGSGFVDVQPVISQVDGQGTRVDHVTIYHVPYTRNYGGNAAVIMDPVNGDIGTLHVHDRDISVFRDQITQGNTTLVLPGSNRRYSLSDSIYEGGLLSNAPQQYDTYTNSGITRNDVNNNQLVMNQSGHSLIAAVGNANVTANAGNANVTASQVVNISGGSGVNIGGAGGAGGIAVSGAGGVSFPNGLAQPTYTTLTSGSSATYTTPSGCLRIKVRMCGGGGGGGAATTNAGSPGTNTSFGSWTAVGGSGGPVGGIGTQGGAGGTGGTNGTGTQIARFPGGRGHVANPAASINSGGPGGANPFGGAGVASSGVGATNTGAGGGGASDTGVGQGAGGGAGEYVEFSWPSPPATITYTVGPGGNGGTAGGVAGGNGAAGIILIEEFYY